MLSLSEAMRSANNNKKKNNNNNGLLTMYPPSGSSPVKKLQCKKKMKNYVIKV